MPFNASFAYGSALTGCLAIVSLSFRWFRMTLWMIPEVEVSGCLSGKPLPDGRDAIGARSLRHLEHGLGSFRLPEKGFQDRGAVGQDARAEGMIALTENPVLERRRSGRIHRLKPHLRSHTHARGVHLDGLEEPGAVEEVHQLLGARGGVCLPLLRRLVLGVLAQIPELSRLFDRGRDHGLEIELELLELGLEPLVGGTRHDGVPRLEILDALTFEEGLRGGATARLVRLRYLRVARAAEEFQHGLKPPLASAPVKYRALQTLRRLRVERSLQDEPPKRAFRAEKLEEALRDARHARAVALEKAEGAHEERRRRRCPLLAGIRSVVLDQARRERRRFRGALELIRDGLSEGRAQKRPESRPAALP